MQIRNSVAEMYRRIDQCTSTWTLGWGGGLVE